MLVMTRSAAPPLRGYASYALHSLTIVLLLTLVPLVTLVMIVTLFVLAL